MALTPGVNSWATVAEADAYLENRIGATAWFSLATAPATPGADSKESMLISAFYWLSTAVAAGETGENVKNAQIEAAFYLLEHYNEFNERRAFISQGGTEFKYSEREERFNADNLQIPSYIMQLIPEFAGSSAFPILKGEYDE